MRRVVTCFLLTCLVIGVNAQPAENIIIITTDGFRWQELFKGMDSAIANNPKFNQGDSAYIFERYWSNDENERKKN